MSPTSRNTLMIGGALILISLLLVCGPLSDRLGSGGAKVDEAPAVATGPPTDSAGALAAAAAGALAGASLGEAGADVLAADTSDDPCHGVGAEQDDLDCPPVAGAGVVAGATAVVAGATAAALAADGTGGGNGGGAGMPADPPPVSAGVPDTIVAGLAPVLVAGPSAAGAFDDAVSSARSANGGVGPEGRIVDRFAPPVAAPSNAGMRIASALNAGPIIMPCDTAGSGCGNGVSAGTPVPPGGNPPIVPGGPPPIPLPLMPNPPIVPGSPPPLP